MARSSTAPAGAGPLAVFEDGGRDAVPWHEDLSGELDPPGLVHLVLQPGGSVLAADDRFGIAGRGELVILLDVCLYERLSLHLRFGPAAGYQTDGGATLQTERLTTGGRAMLGMHLGGFFAIRVGFELGAAFVAVGSLRPVFWGSGLFEMGFRFGDGRVELGVQGAIVSRAGVATGPFATREAGPVGESPRLGGYIGVTL